MTTMTQELTDRQYEIADAISEYVDARPGKDFNASQLARAAKCSTHEAHAVLNHMVRENWIKLTGRGGAWARYRRREFGEMN